MGAWLPQGQGHLLSTAWTAAWGRERERREEEKENSELYSEDYGARKYVVEGKTGMFLPQQGLDSANKPPPGLKEPFPGQERVQGGLGAEVWWPRKNKRPRAEPLF